MFFQQKAFFYITCFAQEFFHQQTPGSGFPGDDFFKWFSTIPGSCYHRILIGPDGFLLDLARSGQRWNKKHQVDRKRCLKIPNGWGLRRLVAMQKKMRELYAPPWFQKGPKRSNLYIHQSWRFNHPPKHLEPILQGWTSGILKCLGWAT